MSTSVAANLVQVMTPPFYKKKLSHKFIFALFNCFLLQHKNNNFQHHPLGKKKKKKKKNRQASLPKSTGYLLYCSPWEC